MAKEILFDHVVSLDELNETNTVCKGRACEALSHAVSDAAARFDSTEEDIWQHPDLVTTTQERCNRIASCLVEEAIRGEI